MHRHLKDRPIVVISLIGIIISYVGLTTIMVSGIGGLDLILLFRDKIWITCQLTHCVDSTSNNSITKSIYALVIRVRLRVYRVVQIKQYTYMSWLTLSRRSRSFLCTTNSSRNGWTLHDCYVTSQLRHYTVVHRQCHDRWHSSATKLVCLMPSRSK